MQHYALLGPTTVFEAQGGQRFARNAQSPNHWDWITKGLEFNEKRLWDSHPGLEGYYNYNYKTAPTTNKNYWMLEQGFNAGLMLARLTSDPLRRERALRMAQGSVDFFYTYLNQKNGSAVLESDRDGVIDPDFAYVGDQWDAGYHASEFAWLVYLYGNLLNERKTVSLYYKLAASSWGQPGNIQRAEKRRAVQQLCSQFPHVETGGGRSGRLPRHLWLP